MCPQQRQPAHALCARRPGRPEKQLWADWPSHCARGKSPSWWEREAATQGDKWNCRMTMSPVEGLKGWRRAHVTRRSGTASLGDKGGKVCSRSAGQVPGLLQEDGRPEVPGLEQGPSPVVTPRPPLPVRPCAWVRVLQSDACLQLGAFSVVGGRLSAAGLPVCVHGALLCWDCYVYTAKR